MLDFLNQGERWIVLSFILFVVLAYVAGRKQVAAKLDGRIAAARNSIETAEKLRAEAEALLNEYERKHAAAVTESESIIATAKEHAKQIRANAAADLETAMQRREQQVKERLKRMEDDAARDLRAYAAGLAAKATRSIIAETMTNDANARLVEQSANKIAGQLS